MKVFDQNAEKLLDCIAAPVFVLHVHSSGSVSYCAWNTFAERASGLAKDDVIGKSAIDLYPGRYGRIANQHHERAAQAGETVCYELKLQLLTELRSVKTTLTPMFDDIGNVVALVGMSVDLTKQRQQQQFFVESQSEFEFLASEMENFLKFAAHDLQSPKEHAASVAGALKEDFQDLGDGKLELIETLEKIVLDSSILISEVLSHLRANNGTKKKKRFNLEELCSSIFVVLDPDGLHDLSSNRRVIFGDPIGLQIVLHGLLKSAIERLDQERLVASVDFEADGPQRLMFSIRINGRALIDPAFASFGPDENHCAAVDGLTDIEQILELHGCYVRAETDFGEECTHICFNYPGTLASISSANLSLETSAA